MNNATDHYPPTPFHFQRERINQLLTKATQYPLVVICAGAGYGKSRAVSDFIRGTEAITVWTQLTERDNVGARFWENYVRSVAQINPVFAEAMRVLGFPDSKDKINRYFSIMKTYLEIKPRIHVFDDFHFIDDPAVMYFVESSIGELPRGTSLFFITRSISNMNIASLVSRGHMFDISENELKFTESELANYFKQQGIFPKPDDLQEIYEDTDGWAFALNLIVRSYQKAPSYKGFLRNAMKTNVFALMEAEYDNELSQSLQSFLIHLSLIDHLSVELVALLAGGDKKLIAELGRLNTYVRLDTYTNSYLIHHLFLQFLREKQAQLTKKERNKTYQIAADWCNTNGIKIDALTYYEKIEDYASIVAIFHELPTLIPYDIARYTTEIFDRAPEDAFDRVPMLAATRVRSVMRLGLMRKAAALLEHYEKRYQHLPADNLFRNQTLGGLYYCMGIMHALMCTEDDRYDFDVYFKKMDECLTWAPIDPKEADGYPTGAWISLAGSAREGAPQEYIDALSRTEGYVSHCLYGTMTGMTDMARGELLFYQGEMADAEPLILHGLARAKEQGQFEIVHMGLGYLVRIAAYQGNFANAEQKMKCMKTLLDESAYHNRYVLYDIYLGWYYAYLGLAELLPDWLKDRFASAGHAFHIENSGNQIKALYYYLTRNYTPLLVYMREQRQKKPILYGRIEMLVMEACIYGKLKDKGKAMAVLKEAYEAAAPNGIIMPFISRGMDMRTLCSGALKEPRSGMPAGWLEMIRSKSSTFAKRQSHMIAEYNRTYHIKNGAAVTQRETEIITDLSHGLSPSEIAVNRSLSVNTVRTMINAIHKKLGTENLADLIRVSIKDKLI